MKLNFGYKIVILYISFVALIVTLVYKCFNYKVDLVSKDYYAKELAFQDKIDASLREAHSNSTINYTTTKNGILFFVDSSLATKKINGTITFYRPSNSALDIVKPIQFNAGKQIIPFTGFKKGHYKIQLDYTIDDLTYYKEHNLEFN